MTMLVHSLTLYLIACNFWTAHSFGFGQSSTSKLMKFSIDSHERISSLIPLNDANSGDGISYVDNDHDDDEEAKDAITQSQLESLLQNTNPRATSTSSSSKSQSRGNNNDLTKDQRLRQATEEEIEAAERIAGNVNVPKTGISINDEMTSMQAQEKFITRLFPLDLDEFRYHDDGDNNDDEGEKQSNTAKDFCTNNVAALQTITAETEGDEPMRYIVAHDRYTKDHPNRKYAMIDVPPYSDELVQQISDFMTVTTSAVNDNGEDGNDEKQVSKGTLATILLTCKNGLHYDEEPAVYVTRKSDLVKWKKAFPNVDIVMYRLDTPRDCRDSLAQMLDGYGPWALNNQDSNHSNDLFVETGRPLTRMEWDSETQKNVLDNGEMPPDDIENEEEDDEKYSPKAIRQREANKDILAVYTPGHTFGSVSYLFPKLKVCCSGFTMPVEESRQAANIAGITNAGPAMDYRGYITTNSGGINKQIESSRALVNTYGDRFSAILPSKGPPVSMGHLSTGERQRLLHDMLDEFAELGRVYESMGII